MHSFYKLTQFFNFYFKLKKGNKKKKPPMFLENDENY